jgi:preprotein translocase subunit SecA
MDYLREGIHLRGFAQIDPLVAYKNEAFDLFTDLMNSIWGDFARMIFHVEVEVEGAPPPQPQAGGGVGQIQYSGGSGTQQPSALMDAAQQGGGGVAYAQQPGGAGAPEYAEEPTMPVVQQRRVDEHETLGRNDPCWCGSGKKFKKCHGA